MLKCEWSVALFSEVFKRQTMPYVNLIWSDLAAVPDRTASSLNCISISYGPWFSLFCNPIDVAKPTLATAITNTASKIQFHR
jgi:hypothetical protein